MSYLGLDLPTANPLLPPASTPTLRTDFREGFSRPNIPSGSIAEKIVDASKTAVVPGGRKIPWLWIGVGVVGLVVVWRFVRSRRSPAPGA